MKKRLREVPDFAAQRKIPHKLMGNREGLAELRAGDRRLNLLVEEGVRVIVKSPDVCTDQQRDGIFGAADIEIGSRAAVRAMDVTQRNGGLGAIAQGKMTPSGLRARRLQRDWTKLCAIEESATGWEMARNSRRGATVSFTTSFMLSCKENSGEWVAPRTPLSSTEYAHGSERMVEMVGRAGLATGLAAASAPGTGAAPAS